MPDSQDHYFTVSPQGADARREIDVTLAGRAVRVVTGAGVFSPQRLDPGSAVLLRSVGFPAPAGDLLDLGCGWGPLALTMAHRSPEATVWAVDVNERAVELTAENAERLRLTNVRAVTPEKVPADMRFAEIWSNPPIRIGKEALHSLLLEWLPRLEPGATARLVVQRNLGADSLIPWLDSALAERTGMAWTVSKTGSAKGYRVIDVSPTA